MIPEPAIQAAAETFAYATGNDWHQVSAPDQEIYLQEAQAALEAALPCLEAALRQQIANEISDAAITLTSGSIAEVARSVQRQAARIAEEGAFHCCAHPKCPGGSICCCPDAEEGNTK